MKVSGIVSLIAIILGPFMAVDAQSQRVEAGILKSVFCIKYGAVTGTAFLVSYDSSDYLVTAKHLFPTGVHNQKLQIEILQDRAWKKGEVTLFVHANPKIDIAVLKHTTNNRKRNGFSMGGSFQISQDCFFLGFPFGLTPIDDPTMNSGFPIPMVKKATISSSSKSPDGTLILLDGINNNGFSGGPVIVSDAPIKGQTFTNRVIGVVVAYIGDPEKTIKTPIGEFLTNENTGIVIAYSISHVNEILEANKAK